LVSYLKYKEHLDFFDISKINTLTSFILLKSSDLLITLGLPSQRVASVIESVYRIRFMYNQQIEIR